ncbi:MAG: flagellar filament capping protein FliD [Gammaproteobacteria bacterium]|nr:flagellar filament capping protein FliD [Gammaproteobacteria bacterium]
MLSAAGIGSGLDVDSIVSQLMAFERRPLVTLQNQLTDIDAKVSAYGELKSALSTFQTAMQGLSTPAALKVFTTTSGTDNVFTASASNTAAASSFEVEVVRLAERHKFASAEMLDTDTIGGRRNNDGLNIQVGSDSANVLSVDLSTASTLGDIRDAINTDAANPGVTATLVFGNNGNQKLVLTARDSGADNALTLSYKGRVGAADFGFQEINNIGGDTTLLDAEISVDGYSVTRATNTIDDVITGVTLDLHNADPGIPYTLDIGRDTAAVAESVQAFADAYNEILTSIDTLRDKGLATDSALFGIEQGLRSVINTPATGLNSGLAYLAEVGVTFSREGIMTVNATDVESVLANNFNAISELFSTAGQGFANRLDARVDDWLDIDGLINGRTDGLDSRKRLLQSREESVEYRMGQIEASLYAEFTRLDTLLGSMQVTSDYLSQQLQLLPSFNNDN